MKSTVTNLFILLSFYSLTHCVSSSKHDELVNEHTKTQKNLEDSQNKINELESLIAELERKLGTASANKKTMSDSIIHMKTALKEASLRKQEVEKRMNEYRKLIHRFKTLTDAGELSIKIVDGRMVVALPSDVLFSSGSAKLSKKGTQTIDKVSKLLVTIPEKKYQIEGHTDNVPIRSVQFPSNWQLASARALNVLNTMIQAGMPKTRISAASFSDTKPVVSNDNKKGRSANRRIEIVVIPDLSQLPGYEELQKASSDSN